jgi:HEAT repeat protein
MHSLENLIQELIDPDIQCANGARRSLVTMGSTVIEYLTQSLANASDQQRWKIIQTLSEIGDRRAAPALVPYLDSGSPAILAAIAQFLGAHGDEAVVEPLVKKLLDHRSNDSLIWVIQALGKLKDRRAVVPLIQTLDEAKSPPVRYTAIEALAQIGDLRGYEAVMRYENDPDRHVQAHAQRALQRFAQQQAI